MPLQTNTQKMARIACERVAVRKLAAEYSSFAREFPSLVHSCGLAQAVVFATAKTEHHRSYLEDLAAVLQAAGHSSVKTSDELSQTVRESPVSTYIRLSRNALLAAGWLKRYVEAFKED